MTVQVVGRVVAGGNGVSGGSMYDSNVTELEFVGLPTLANDQLVTLHWVSTSNSSYGSVEILTASTNKYTYKIGHKMTVAKAVKAFLRITAGKQIWNTQAFVIDLNDLPVIDQTGADDTNPSAIQAALDIINGSVIDISEALEQAENAVNEANQAVETAETAATRANTAAESAEQAAEAALANTHPPIIQNGTWWMWDTATSQYVDTTLPTSGVEIVRLG